ncbi:MAG TPA: glycosyltransferase family 2 protein [Steroidobacteraceae bacterium]|nr:glycosyltransferase family 2 protein [Steroidobacteraceae bacterium]
MSARVSVIIPTYNRARDLRRALASVISQSLQDWEVLVVDNHSQDDTARVVEEFRDARVRLLSVHNHGVIGVSRNLGVAHAGGEYLAFLDSDDWWLPAKLERCVRALDAGADVVYHDLYLARSSSARPRLRRAATRPLASPVLTDLLQGGNALVNSGVAVRRSTLLAAGGLSEEPRVASWEDYDCWLRLARITERFHRVGGALGFYWAGGGNVTAPARTVRNLAHLREIYFAPAGCARDSDLPGWYHYSLGRAHCQLGAYREAVHHLRHAAGGTLTPATRLRSLVALAYALARRGCASATAG